MKKFTFILLAVVIASVMMLGGCANEPVQLEYGEELVTNGGFEDWTGDVPSGWKLVYDGTGFGSVTKGTHVAGTDVVETRNLGDNYLTIKNSDKARTYLTQTIKLEPGASYKVTAVIRVPKALASSTGAHVTFLEDLEFTKMRRYQKYEWDGAYYEYYFTTDLETVNLCFAVGAPGHETKGEVSFDNISVVKVDSETLRFDHVYTLSFKGSEVGFTDFSHAYVIIGLVLTVALFVLGFFALKMGGKGGTPVYEGTVLEKVLTFLKNYWHVIVLLVIALGLRVTLGLVVYGFRDDVNAMLTLANSFRTTAFATGYKALNANYTPMMLYSLWISGQLLGLFNATGSFAVLLVKLPSILADIATSIVIYCFVKKHATEKRAFISAGIYALLPAVFTNSAVWGQFDSFLALFAVLALTALVDKKYVQLIVSFTLAVLSKANALFMLPVIVAYLVWNCIKDKSAMKKTLITAGSALVGFYVVTLPLTLSSIGEAPFLVFEKYISKIATFNAFNLGTEGALPVIGVILNIVYALCAVVAVVLMYLNRKNRLDALLLTAFSIVLTWFFGSGYSDHFLLPALSLLLVYAAIAGERRVFGIALGFSILHFISTAVTLGVCGYLTTYLSGVLTAIPTGSDYSVIMGVLYGLLTIYFAYVCSDVTKAGKRGVPTEEKGE